MKIESIVISMAAISALAACGQSGKIVDLADVEVISHTYPKHYITPGEIVKYNVEPEAYNLNELVPGVDNMAWTWWFGPQVLSVKDVKEKLWWGFTSSRGYSGIAEYDPTCGFYKKTYLKKRNSADDHNNTVVVPLADKRVGCIYTNGHDNGRQVFVRISKSVECIDEFAEPIVIDFNGTTTYIQYFYMLGKHYIFTRTRNETYKWAYTCSEDFIHWSEPADFISATNKRYYIKLQKVSGQDGIIRITAYGHPTQSKDSNIRMGFINFKDGKIYDKDGSTVVTGLGECFYYTDLSIALPHDEGKVFRLFDVAETPMDEFTVAVASFTPKVKTDSKYQIYSNGKLQTLCAGGTPFWNSSCYLGGISFIDGHHAVISRNDGESDHVELWDYVTGRWGCTKSLWAEELGDDQIRNIRPIVDYNKRYVLWQRGSYDNTQSKHTFCLEARIYNLETDTLIK